MYGHIALSSVEHFQVYLGVKTCEVFFLFKLLFTGLCCVDSVASLYSLFYVTPDFHRFFHQVCVSMSRVFGGHIGVL